MKKYNLNKGVTLIALIITIIVLLILAGITLAMVMGENGIIAKAQRAKEQTQDAQDKENIALKKLEDKLNGKTILDDINADSDLKSLLQQANMSITLSDLINTPAIVDNAGLIDNLSSSDVTKTSNSNPIEYTVSNNRGFIRTPTEHNDGEGVLAWNAFNSPATHAHSAYGCADQYYIEYEFPTPVYAMRLVYRMGDGASAYGTRTFVIQGTNESGPTDSWTTVSDDILWEDDSSRDFDANLNYTNAYKRYRLYVKSIGYNSYYTTVALKLYGKIAN